MNDITIEPHPDCGIAVYSHGEYETWSVLAGHNRRVFLDRFDTVEEAQRAYPTAEVLQHSTKVEINLPKQAPAWFDPLDAGESWDEID
jgi:hypothetical protein